MYARVAEIMESFRDFRNVYERDAVDAALSLKSEITPHLIAALRDLVADPEAFIVEEDVRPSLCRSRQHSGPRGSPGILYYWFVLRETQEKPAKQAMLIPCAQHIAWHILSIFTPTIIPPFPNRRAVGNACHTRT